MYTTNAVKESSGYKSFHYGIISRIKKLGEILVESSLHYRVKPILCEINAFYAFYLLPILFVPF